MNWNHSVLYYNHSITDKFDSLITEINKEIQYLDDLEEWDMGDNAKYDLLLKVRALYEECQAEQMRDI